MFDYSDIRHGLWRMIYGKEAQIVRKLTGLIKNDKGQEISHDVVVIDFETTGLIPDEDEIIEIGAVKIRNGQIVESFKALVRPKEHIPEDITELTGITDEMVKKAARIGDIMPKLEEFCKDCVVVAHYADFDAGFFKEHSVNKELVNDLTFVDTFAMSILLMPKLYKHKLISVAKALDIKMERAHRAGDDAKATAQIYLKFIDMLKEKGITKFSEAEEKMQEVLSMVKEMPIRYDGSADKLRKICNERVYKLYGKVLAGTVETRLADELTKIITNGYADKYCLMAELIERANLKDNQYYTRGLTGSSFVAYLCGITGRINPLPPHYRCECAKYTEFVDEVKMPYELPDKICPYCGKKLIKDGFNLPYQLFMGADGRKMPQFSLNVSSDKQKEMREIMKGLTGVGDVIAGGTYNERLNRFGCNPGLMVLIPDGLGRAEELMPIQTLDDGKVVTGIDYHDIWQFDTIAVFADKTIDELEAAGGGSDIYLCNIIPECFSNMVYCDGVAHGVNTQICDEEKIIFGEDVYNYLINYKISSDRAYEIAELVRKGCGIDSEEEKYLRKAGISKKYIKFCNEVDFLYPKAQSIAQTMMTYLLAWRKEHIEECVDAS